MSSPRIEDINWALDTMKVLVSHDIYQAATREDYRTTISFWCDEHHELLHEMGLQVAAGCTKVCIIDEEEEFVIKFDIVDKCCGASYCDLESRNYKMAVEAGLGRWFAGTWEVGEVAGRMVYLQQYARTDEDATSDSFYDYICENYYDGQNDEETQDSIACSVDEMDNEDRIYAMIGYDHDASKVVDFCDQWDINDLHAGNWGYINDEAVMIDYSGY